MKPTTTPLDVLLGENARTLFQEGVRAAVRVYREDLAEGGQLAAKAALVHALREETSHDTVLCMLAEAIHQLAQKDAPMSVDAASIAEYDWLQDTSARDDGRLHAPTEQIIDHYAYYWDHGEQYWETHDSGPALCGRDGWWTIPGVGARLTATRCPACCSLAGIPEGAGSPKNTPECRVLLGLETP